MNANITLCFAQSFANGYFDAIFSDFVDAKKLNMKNC
jgi:hypothetical protein